MITYVISSATFASTEAIHPTNPQLRRPPSDYAMALPVNVPEVPARRAGKFVLSGDLRIRDVTQPVELTVEFGGARRDPYGRDIVGFSAHTEINREDYGLVWNVALESGGVLVGRKVRIEIAGEAIRQQ
jgi:hypothetical protein